MNLVIDDAVEVQVATRDKAASRRQLGMNSINFEITENHKLTSTIGQILLKGDNVTLIQSLD